MIPPTPKCLRMPFYFCLAGFLLALLLNSRLECVERYPSLFSTSYVLSFLLLFGMLRSFPEDWPTRRQWLLIASIAVLVRLVYFPYPASNDVNRYIWEGYVSNQGFNPYLLPPDSFLLEPYITEIWHPISHKNLTACYPPLAMLLFRAAAWLSPTIEFFKAMMILFDLATIGLLMLLLRHYDLPANRVILYALNPLVLIFIAGEGHLDAIQIFFIVLSLYLLARENFALAFFSLGCGAMAKYFAALIAPFIINSQNWKKGIWFFVAIILCYLPFGDTGKSLLSSLIYFGTANTYNESITLFLREILGLHAVGSSLILLVIFLSVIFVIVHQPLKSAYLVFGSVLLLLTTLNPWYLANITPFLAFFPSRGWFYLQMFVVPALYLQYHTAFFYMSYWITAVEYLPFYGLIIWDTYWKISILPKRLFDPVKSLSVVVPVLNEAPNIRDCLQNLQAEKAITEVIVVDGGSEDGTPELAQAMGAKVMTASRGRGHQIRFGVDQCQGDVILVLHGDCFLEKGTTERLISVLNDNPACTGGAMGMRYTACSASGAVLSWLNNARSLWAGISFGDQAQFFRRATLDLIDGFPDLMLLEDVELSMRLKEIGPVCFVPKGVLVSNRRWTKTGYWLNSLKVLWICFSYLVRRRLQLVDSKGEKLYELYYQSGRPS